METDRIIELKSLVKNEVFFIEKFEKNH